jgi:N-acetylneuraminic acid mutarotase
MANTHLTTTILHSGEVALPQQRSKKATRPQQTFSADLPPPRQGHAAILFDEKIYIFGGRTYSKNRNEKTFLNDVWSFSLVTNTWTNIQTIDSPEPRHNISCLLFDNTAILFGGQGYEDKIYNDVWYFDMINHTWTKITTNDTPSPRHSCSTVISGSNMIVIGGRTSTSYSREVYVFDIPVQTWSKILCKGEELVHPRDYHKMTLLDKDHVLVFGGYFYDGKEHYFNDILILDLSTWSWSLPQVTGDIPAPRNRQLQEKISTDGISHEIFVHGGNCYDSDTRKGEFFGDAYILKVAGSDFKCEWNKITMKDDANTPNRGHHASVVWNSSVVMFGGECKRSRFNDVRRFVIHKQ